jgi:hypothetical protein
VEWKEKELFAYRITEGDFFERNDEHWKTEKMPGGSRFTLNDYIEFPFGSTGMITGWFAALIARETGEGFLANSKRVVEVGAKAQAGSV